MNHQVVISFDVDDEKIAENIVNAAARQVATQILEKQFGYNSFNKTLSASRVHDFVRDAVVEVLEPQKSEIVEEAVKEVASSMMRSKTVREKLAERLE